MNALGFSELARAKRGNWIPRAVITAACVAGLVTVAARAASADPIRMVTSGIVYQLVEDGETGFTFRGSGFDIGGGEVVYYPADPCGPCAPGSRVSLSSTMTAHLNAPGSATIDGHTWDNVFFKGTFHFDAGDVTVPNVPVGSTGIFPVTTFTFMGTLAGYDNAALTGQALFSTQLRGLGTATEGFFNYPTSNGRIFRDGFKYEFANAAATPEPGTLLLFAPGAAWVVRQIRRRRNAIA